jgi:hypothetical protein
VTITARLLASDRAIPGYGQRTVAGPRLALDRSVRSIDADGRLHVAMASISRAGVNPYWGQEVVDWQELGLNPNRIYQLFRPPEELSKAASTFNNLPLLASHVMANAADHRPDDVVGSTGTDARFTDPYLDNSLVVWAQFAIDGIESNKQRQLSAAYRYVPLIEAGTYRGVRYDIRMTNIRGSHVALVSEGRAGADVVVGDAALSGSIRSRLKLTSQRNYAMDDDALLSKVAEFCDGKMQPDDIQALLKMLMPDDVPGAMDHRAQALGALAAARHQRTRSAVRSGPDPRFPNANRLVRS